MQSDAAHRFEQGFCGSGCPLVNVTICNLLIIWRSRRLSCRALFFPKLSGHATAYSELHVVTLKGNHLVVPYACRSDACITNCSER